MKIEIYLNDKNGEPINFGDTIELFNWSINDKYSLGTAELIWNNDEGRIDTMPSLVDDPYDLVTKCLPNCIKVQ